MRTVLEFVSSLNNAMRKIISLVNFIRCMEATPAVVDIDARSRENRYHHELKSNSLFKKTLCLFND